MKGWILCAQRLVDGRPVYLGPAGWSEHLAAAEIAPSEEACRARLARMTGGREEVVDPVAIEVVVAQGLPVPRRLRERIRALGPSVHPELWRDPDPGGGRRVPL